MALDASTPTVFRLLLLSAALLISEIWLGTSEAEDLPVSSGSAAPEPAMTSAQTPFSGNALPAREKFLRELAAAGKDLDEGTAIDRAKDVLERQQLNGRTIYPGISNCRLLEGEGYLFFAAEKLVSSVLSTRPGAEEKRAVQEHFETFWSMCAPDRELGQAFLADIANTLRPLREQRLIETERQDIAKKKASEEARRQLKERQLQAAQQETERNARIQAENAERAKAWEERLSRLKSGAQPIETIRDAAALYAASDAGSLILSPPYAASKRMIVGYEVLKQWEGGVLICEIGTKIFGVAIRSNTRFLGQARDQLRVGGLIRFVGTYDGALEGAAVFSAAYIGI